MLDALTIFFKNCICQTRHAWLKSGFYQSDTIFSPFFSPELTFCLFPERSLASKQQHQPESVLMKGRHQFRRRFSLQPSFLKEEPEDEEDHHHSPRYYRCYPLCGKMLVLLYFFDSSRCPLNWKRLCVLLSTIPKQTKYSLVKKTVNVASKYSLLDK